MPPKKKTTKRVNNTDDDSTADVSRPAAIDAPEITAPKARRPPEYIFVETPTVLIKKIRGPSTTVVSDKEFTVFPTLPLEVREMIWECSRLVVGRTFFIHPRVERVLKPRDRPTSAKNINQERKVTSDLSTTGENVAVASGLPTATKNDKELSDSHSGKITTTKARGAGRSPQTSTRLTRSQHATEKKNSTNKSQIVPIVLRVSRESRRVGMRTYTVLFSHPSPSANVHAHYPTNVYVNYQLDKFIFQSPEALILFQGITDLDPIIDAWQPAPALAAALPNSRNESEKKLQHMVIGSCRMFDKYVYMQLLPRFQKLKRVVIDCGYPDPEDGLLAKPFEENLMIEKLKEESEKGHYTYSKPVFKFITHDKLHRNYLD